MTILFNFIVFILIIKFMNKRFFTLLVAMIATISFGAFAQISAGTATGTVNGKEFLLETGAENAKRYLAVQDGKLVSLSSNELQGATLASLNSMKWKVSATKGTTTGAVAVYSFTNVATGLELALNKNRAEGYNRSDANTTGIQNELNGDIKVWNPSDNVVTVASSYYFNTIENDSVISLVEKTVDGVVTVIPKAYKNLAKLAEAAGVAPVDLEKLNAAVTALNAVIDFSDRTWYTYYWGFSDDNTADFNALLLTAREKLAAAGITVATSGDNNLNDVTGNNSQKYSRAGDRKNVCGYYYLPIVNATIAALNPSVTTSEVLIITPKVATGNIALSANDMNTYLGKVGQMNNAGKILATANSEFALSIAKKITTATPLTGFFQAEAIGASGPAYQDDIKTWMQLKTKNDKGETVYLVVDTVAIGGTGQAWNDRLRLTVDKAGNEKRLAASYNFSFYYDAVTGNIYGVSQAYKNNGTTYTWPASDYTQDNALRSNNVISLAELGDDKTSNYVSAVTVGNDTLWFKLNAEATYTPITLTPGAYLVKVAKSNYPYAVGKYWATNLCGNWEYVTYDPAVQELQHMPSAQWIIESKSDKTAKYTNRENDYMSSPYLSTFGVKDADGKLVANQFFFLGGDTLELIPVTDAKNKKLGYFFDEELDTRIDSYTFRFLHALGMDLPINMTEDSVLVINKEDKPLYLRVVSEGTQVYGWNPDDKNVLKDKVARLERETYKIGLYETIDREGTPKAWVIYNHNTNVSDDKRYEIVEADKYYATPFYFKEYYHAATGKEGAAEEYYVLVEAYVEHYGRVAVDERTLELVHSNLCNTTGNTVGVATFKIAKDSGILYRTIAMEEGKRDTNIRIFRANATEPERLYEDANSKNYSEVINGSDKTRTSQINFLGIEGRGDAYDKESVLQARYVRGTIKPQYLLMVDYDVVEGEKGELCPICAALPEAERPEKCIHDKPGTDGAITARVMYSFLDSMGKSFNEVKKAYEWEGYARVGFVDVKFLDNDSVMYLPGVKIDTEKDKNNNYKSGARVKFNAKDEVAEGAHEDYLWSLRLTEEDEDGEFLMESWGDLNVAPTYGYFIKKQNGVPVMNYTAFKTIYNSQAEIFDLEYTSDKATSNEGPAAGDVKVYGVAGAVTVTGAAGEAVVITDVLGKVIVNTVIKSDAATFSAPAGVAIVKVAGEAQKVLVK
ncbi:hypothetical protein M2480_000749 [Parabacteroides sp. PFB2-12]|uniref:DUF6383 domain-containing protein n=1 Tax=unclassified Parabacteroides TaxID=2649774 RepID=UPI002475516F|nr:MULTISPECIES: DUF6383 domain-containing protein [unclassified Parabacteroides]MDH6341794.1 hypothetical protein [Parabacteroides sp. PM6-13]MDH6389783.1 hypothetical protein [Parabacteroides sp. PFB2-12]